jgi:hypothetical protein
VKIQNINHFLQAVMENPELLPDLPHLMDAFNHEKKLFSTSQRAQVISYLDFMPTIMGDGKKKGTLVCAYQCPVCYLRPHREGVWFVIMKSNGTQIYVCCFCSAVWNVEVRNEKTDSAGNTNAPMVLGLRLEDAEAQDSNGKILWAYADKPPGRIQIMFDVFKKFTNIHGKEAEDFWNRNQSFNAEDFVDLMCGCMLGSEAKATKMFQNLPMKTVKVVEPTAVLAQFEGSSLLDMGKSHMLHCSPAHIGTQQKVYDLREANRLGYIAKQRFDAAQWKVLFAVFYDIITTELIQQIANDSAMTGSKKSGTCKLVKDFAYAKWKENDPDYGKAVTLAMFGRENKTEDEEFKAAESLRRMKL